MGHISLMCKMQDSRMVELRHDLVADEVVAAEFGTEMSFGLVVKTGVDSRPKHTKGHSPLLLARESLMEKKQLCQ